MNIKLDLSDITQGQLTDKNDWEGTGIFDVLINAVNKNIEAQYQKGRINGSDFANVYLSSMQAVLEQAIEYSLRKDLTEAQIATAYTERVIKDKEAAALGLDTVVKTANSTPETVYTPKYEVM